MPEDELQALKKASEGLVYPSESDAPFEPFRWAAEGAGSAREQVAARACKGQTIKGMAVEDFFAELEDAPDADRYRRLKQVLESQLTGLQVLRVGSIRIDVYLIGKTLSGDWAGLHTISVET